MTIVDMYNYTSDNNSKAREKLSEGIDDFGIVDYFRILNSDKKNLHGEKNTIEAKLLRLCFNFRQFLKCCIKFCYETWLQV